jgi:O-antigen ligase
MFYYYLKSLVIVFLFINLYTKIDLTIKHLEEQLIFVSISASLYFLGLLYVGITLEERQIASNLIDKIDVKYQLPDRNYASILLSYGFIFVLLFYFSTRKVIHILSMILILGVQVLIASRAGIISSLGAFIIFIIIYTRGIKIKLFSIFLLFILIFSVYFAFDTNTLFDRFQDQEDVSSAGDRTGIWETSFKNFKSQSIFTIIFGQGFFNGTLNLSDGTSIHNNYLEVLYDYGIVGLFIYLILFYFIYSKGSMSQKILASCFLLSALTLSPLMSLEFWFVFLLLIVNDNKLKQNFYIYSYGN